MHEDSYFRMHCLSSNILEPHNLLHAFVHPSQAGVVTRFSPQFAAHTLTHMGLDNSHDGQLDQYSTNHCSRAV
jgi:hypothetical protein